MTIEVAIATALSLGYTHVRTPDGAVKLVDWRLPRVKGYDSFKIVNGEILVDEPRGGWNGAWPLLTRGQERTAA